MKRLLILGIVIIVLVVGAFFVFPKHAASPTLSGRAKNCVGRQYAEGSSGTCVSDIQTMINFMETDDLTQCPFKGAATLGMNGVYNAATAQQVTVVQNWFNCYNRQEGEQATVAVDGKVAEPTWIDLCTYAYQYPQNAGTSVSPYLKASLAAGKNAGC